MSSVIGSSAPQQLLRVVNFEKLQHYKDRNPPWIKLYNELLDDYQFGRLQDASKWLAIGIMLLASRNNNAIPADPEWIGRRINARDPVDLEPLVSAGIIELYQDASNTLAERSGFAMPETETETETEKSSASKEADAHAPAGFPHGNGNGRLMALLRELNYVADRSDGSILKQLTKHGVKENDAEAAIRGLRLMCDHGKLRQLCGLNPGDQLNMRILYAQIGKPSGFRPLWGAAEDEFRKSLSSKAGLLPVTVSVRA